MLCEHVSDADWGGASHTVEVHVSRLRNKVDRGFDGPLVHTVRDGGYVLRVSE